MIDVLLSGCDKREQESRRLEEVNVNFYEALRKELIPDELPIRRWNSYQVFGSDSNA
jgi:hypothetical protein